MVQSHCYMNGVYKYMNRRSMLAGTLRRANYLANAAPCLWLSKNSGARAAFAECKNLNTHGERVSDQNTIKYTKMCRIFLEHWVPMRFTSSTIHHCSKLHLGAFNLSESIRVLGIERTLAARPLCKTHSQ